MVQIQTLSGIAVVKMPCTAISDVEILGREFEGPVSV